MPRPISYAVFCLKKKITTNRLECRQHKYTHSLRSSQLEHLDYFSFIAPPTNNIYTLSLHDALPICKLAAERPLKDIRDEYNYPKKKGIKDECSRLLEASTMKSEHSSLIPRSEERFSRNAETDIVCRLLLEKKNNYQ